MHAAGIARGALPLPREQQGDQQLKPLHSNRRKSPMTDRDAGSAPVCRCAYVRVRARAPACRQRNAPRRLAAYFPSAQPYNTRAHIYIRTTGTYVRGAKRRAHLYLSLPYRSGNLRLRTRRRSPCQRWLATGSGAF
jgi:hypothetical protein